MDETSTKPERRPTIAVREAQYKLLGELADRYRLSRPDFIDSLLEAWGRLTDAERAKILMETKH